MLYPRKTSKIDDFFGPAERSVPPFATRRSHGIQLNFSSFLGPPEVRKFRLFFDFFGRSEIVSGQQSGRSEPGSDRSADLAKTCPDSDSGWTRMVPFKVPKTRLFAILPDFVIFVIFCDFSRFSRFWHFCQNSGNLPKSTILRCQKSRDFLLLFGHRFECATCVIRPRCVLNMYYFSEFFDSKKIGKIYHFGLNHLSNCWLVYAVGSLRPDSHVENFTRKVFG